MKIYWKFNLLTYILFIILRDWILYTIFDMQLWYLYHCVLIFPFNSIVTIIGVTDQYIIYSYKYLESDSIKHCHVIFIHSLGQPLIVRSHSKVHRSPGNPKEIPTWASCVSNYSYFPWFNRQQTWCPATGSSL